MHLPNQSQPVERNPSSTGFHHDVAKYVDGPDALGLRARGVQVSGYEECYRLTGPAQRTCLLMSTY